MDTEPRLMFVKKQHNNTSINAENDNLYVFVLGNYSKGLKKYG